ncbi:TetR family transcriptional regulator [Paenibacillus macquariensis subsp. defensor]|nr:TetR family transcriptional regulator [Paenibacillus macquariensis subsp. defensor]
MNKRKEHVVHKAHELFIEKGYHATSIQDILNHSGISKGSFYNYFPSKGELFKAVFTSIYSQVKEDRDTLLIGEDLDDIHIFTQQIYLTMESNRKNRMLQLIEDAIVSNDPDLILFIKQSKFLFLNWVHDRFINIFPGDKKPYLLDCAILFAALLPNIHQTSHAMNEPISLKQIIDYCMACITTILEDVSAKGLQLFSPDKIHTLLPNSDYNDFFNNEFSFATLSLKKVIEKVFTANNLNQASYLKLLFFIQEEIMNHKEPRVFLIESALLSLKMCPQINETKEFEHYQTILCKMIQ